MTLIELPRDQATPEAVVQHLRPLRSRPLGRWWRELLDEGLGEVREPRDWSLLPIETWVRVVAMLSNGRYIIRWGTDDGLRLHQGGITHGYLLTGEDSVEDVRAGWVWVTRDGTVKM